MENGTRGTGAEWDTGKESVLGAQEQNGTRGHKTVRAWDRCGKASESIRSFQRESGEGTQAGVITTATRTQTQTWLEMLSFSMLHQMLFSSHRFLLKCACVVWALVS